MAQAPKPAKESPQTGQFLCNQCGKTFDSQDELREHQQTGHKVQTDPRGGMPRKGEEV